MGEPVKIVELARQMIRLAGHTEEEVPIEFSGLRAGEKLYEELLADADTTVPTSIRPLRLAQLQDGNAGLGPLLQMVRNDRVASANEEAKVRLVQVVREYRPSR